MIKIHKMMRDMIKNYKRNYLNINFKGIILIKLGFNIDQDNENSRKINLLLMIY